MEKTDWKRIGWLTAATLVLGAIIGACAGLLTLLLYGVEYVMLGFIESEFIPGAFTVPAVRRIASVTLGLGVAGVIWYLLRTKTEKVPSVKKAVNGGRMPFWQTIVHVVLQIFIVGSGASIGREVAPRELGAMLAQRFCDIFHIGDGEGDAHGVLDRRMVVAVAAGAGLGGVYNAPLAGMFFAVEILLVDVTLEKVAFGLGMSATAAFVATAIKGEHMFYDIGAMQMNSTPSLMLFALLCGTACGVVGALFRKGSQWAESHKPTGRSLMWQMPIAGLVTGLVSIVVPQVMGNGRAAAQLGFSTFIPETAATSGAAQSAASAAASPWTFLAGSDEPAMDVAGRAGAHLRGQGVRHSDDHPLRRIGRRASARHRLGIHAGYDARTALAVRLPRRFGHRVRPDRGRRAALRIPAGSAHGHVPGHGTHRGSDRVLRAGRYGRGGIRLRIVRAAAQVGLIAALIRKCPEIANMVRYFRTLTTD